MTTFLEHVRPADVETETTGTPRRAVTGNGRLSHEGAPRAVHAGRRSPPKVWRRDPHDRPFCGWDPLQVFRALRLIVPATTRSVPGARHCVRRILTDWGWSEEVDTAELLFCELLSNAIQHASGGRRAGEPVEVRITQGKGSLLVSVGDCGRDTTPLSASSSPPAELAESGRGLLLVETMAARWGSHRSRAGTKTWFTLDHAVTD
ncbi:ATP-binding protein [Streptomyces sp. NPDC054887]